MSPPPETPDVVDIEPKQTQLRWSKVRQFLSYLEHASEWLANMVERLSPQISPQLQKENGLYDLDAPLQARWVLRIIIAGVVLLCIWAAIGKVDQVTRTQAVLITADRTQLIQSPDGGVLTELHVKEGQSVKAGQLLVTLQKDRAAAAVSDSSAKVAALRITLARLHAEVYGKPLKFSDELTHYTEYIRIYGGLRGKVDYISADALFAEKASPGVPIGPNNPPIYYIVRVRITGSEFHGEKAREIKMRPGLTASVEIKALERSVLSYLTKPITKTFDQALGER